MTVAYNPNDPLQAGFLAALAQGETGGNSNSAFEGVGGSDLSGAPTDAYGFPQWNGQGNSHAAGTFQFQPGTWDSIASEFNLNFQNPQDQAEGAWELAQQADPNLEQDLSQGNYSTIQSALAKIWPSVTGNAAAPQGLAANLGGAISTGQQLTANQTAANNASDASVAQASSTSGGSSFSWFSVQPILIGLGAVIVLVALWMLLSSQGIVPSPIKVGREIASGV